MTKNRFSKALKHIKKDLNEVAPTNSMSGVYSLNDPGYSLRHPSAPRTFLPDIDGNFPSGIPGTTGTPYIRPAGIWTGDKDWDEVVQANFGRDQQGTDGNSTAGLISENGVVYTALPPNSRSYILGPLVDGFVYNHGSDAYTRIGYIQKDTRQFVLLAYIRGTWKTNFPQDTGAWSSSYNFPVWDGTTVDSSSGFHTYGSFTLADAQWMRAEILAGRYMKNVSYRSSGGIGQSLGGVPGLPGSFYNGSGVGGGSGDAAVAGSGGGGGYGQGGDPTIGDQQTDPPKSGDAEDAGFPWFPFGSLGQKAKDLWDKITDAVGDIKDNLEEFFDDAFDDAVEGAKDFKDSLQDVLDDWSGQPKDNTTVNTGGGQTGGGQTGGGQTGKDTGGNVEHGTYKDEPKDDKPKDDKPKDDKPKDDKPKDDKPKDYGDLSDVLTPGGSLSKDDIKKAKDQVGNWLNKLKDIAKTTGKYLNLAGSGFEAIPTSADALQQYLDNNDPKSPHYRKNDPRSDNYEGPYEPPTDQKWRNEVGQQIKDSLPKWSDWEQRAKNSPDGKTQLTNFEITTLSNNMKPLSGNGDMRFHTFFNSLPVSGDEYSDDIPGKDAITTVTIDKDGNIDIVSNYRFSDRDDVSSGGPLMKMYVQKYMDIDKGDEDVFPFFDKDARYDNRTQTGTTHDVNMRLRLNINGGNSSTWGARAKDVKNFKNSMSNFSLGSMYNSYYPQGKILKESNGLRKVKFVINEIASAAPASTTPTNQTTTQQPTESKETADALAKEYIEKNGPEKTKELIDKTDEYLAAHGQDPKHHSVDDSVDDSGDIAGVYGDAGMIDIDGRGWFVTPSQLQKMHRNPGNYNLRPRDIRLIDGWIRNLQVMNDPQYKDPNSNVAKNVPSWFWYSGYGPAVWSMYEGKPVIWGYNYSGGYGYITPGGGSGDPGTPESGYGTPGFDWETQSGGTSWTFVLHTPKAKPETSPFPKEPEVALGAKPGDDIAWGKPKEPPNPENKQPRGMHFNIINYYNSGMCCFPIPDGWTDDDVRRYVENDSKGFPSSSKKSGNSIASTTGASATDAAILAGKRKKKTMTASYKPKGRRLQESDLNLSRRKIRMLKEIKKPVLVEELPQQKLKKYRPNFKGKFSPQNTPDKTASKESDALVMSGNQKGQAWRTQDKYWSGYETQERMNVIMDRVGHGDLAWQMIVDEAREKNGWKNREIQEHLNIIAAEKGMREQVPDYESPFGYVIHEQGASTEEELDTVMKDPAVKVKHPFVKNLAKRLKGQIDYKDKPSRKGFPDEPPAKQQDGWHPEYGKKYKYDKLDPQSAEAMPPTGNPEIDANVEKAKPKKPRWKHINTESKVDPKVKWEESVDWRSEIEINNSESLIEVENLDDFYKRKQKLNERMTTSSVFSYSLEGSSADHVVMQTGFTGDGDINDYTPNTGHGNSWTPGTHRGGEFTAMTSFTDMENVDDPTGQFGKSVRGFRGVDENGDPDLSPTTSEHPNGTGNGDEVMWPGSTGGFRGVALRGSYNSSPWQATGGPTNENAVGFEEQEEPQQGILVRGIGSAIIFGSTGNPGVPRLAALKAVDTSEMDTFSMNWFTMGHMYVDHVESSPTYGQTFTRDDFRPITKGDDIFLFYWCGDKEGAQSYGEPMSSYGSKHQDGWRPINRKPDGTLDPDVDPAIIPWKPNPVDENGDRIVRGGQYAGPYRGNTFYNAKVHLPEWCRAKNQRFLIVQNEISQGSAYSRFGITSIRFQRRAPMTVVAPLDSPEATAFIRDGSLGKEETTPQKRKKKVDRILKASKEYVNKIVADPFPGTEAEIGEAQGTSGNKYVPQAWDNKKQEFADAGTLDQQKDKFVSKDVKLPPNYSEVEKQIGKKKK